MNEVGRIRGFAGDRWGTERRVFPLGLSLALFCMGCAQPRSDLGKALPFEDTIVTLETLIAEPIQLSSGLWTSGHDTDIGEAATISPGTTRLRPWKTARQTLVASHSNRQWLQLREPSTDYVLNFECNGRQLNLRFSYQDLERAKQHPIRVLIKEKEILLYQGSSKVSNPWQG